METPQHVGAIVAVVAAFVVVFGGAIALVVRQKRRIRETWRAFARTHGLTLIEGPFPSVTGQIEDRTFSMGVLMGRGVGGRPNMQAGVQFTVVTDVRGAVPPGLVAGKRGFLQEAGNVESGDAEFDRKIWVQCPDAAAAGEYLTPARRRALHQVAALDAVLLGPADGGPARLSHVQTGYKVKMAWLEAQRAAFIAAAKALDA
jgi:hypothetical protein